MRSNAQLSNTELADRVGLTPSPCLRRVRRLEEEGIILGYHARVAPEALGRGFEVLVDVDLANQTKDTIRTFEAALVALPEVIEARRMFGSPDYQLIVDVADLSAYELFLTERLTGLPGLGRLQSRFPMKTIKSEAASLTPSSR